ncbi:HK97 gp10 family phage protein [Lacrimispora sp.]|uniref:HK97 gp10 family phage protein n=1 Tax=Lacrimispora sp. TaxID=2719234 RepID=UPI002866DF0C|nr:HK97 gp10 family phage protein [Lacrimispora sp.]MDR7813383.1 HK97 gp10 family phage protein [Lacrimispora sp.]
MSTFGQATRKRLEQLRRQGQNVPKIMGEVMEGATIAAVERATELTPPNGSTISGTGTRSGDMAQAWELDSITKPLMTGGSVRTTLANNLQYASYVNDGHRMDQHFVPGLIINGNMLEKVDPKLGGITVGTNTPYVKGKYMKQAAIGRYKNVVRRELDKRVKENFK